MDRVTGARVRQLKLQQRVRGQSVSTPTQADPGGGESPQARNGSLSLIAQKLLSGTGGEPGSAYVAGRVGDAQMSQPLGELRRGPQAEDVAQIQGVVKAGALVIQHHVVGARHAHDES